MRVHIEGFGVQGTLLALFLERAGVEFTWSDIDAPQTAWKACTGAIYPSDSAKFGDDMACHATWARWYEQSFMPRVYLERALWWFNHKTQPPHGGRYPTLGPTEHGLRRAAAPLYSYHFNAQAFVQDARLRYRANRVPVDHRVLPGEYHIVSHGWSLRQSHVYWGWTRLVELEYDHDLYGDKGWARPAFYFREGRFIMAYAYPVPGTTYWYAGSHIIRQPSSRARSLSILERPAGGGPSKYERWRDNFERLSGGAARVRRKRESDAIEGWRPACRDDAWVQRQGKNIEFRPLWNNGVRHFPQQLQGLGEALDLPELKVLTCE